MTYKEWKKNYVENPASDFFKPAEVRTVDEFKFIAEKLRPLAEKYTGRKSLWSGNIRIDNSNNPYKDWNCDIVLMSNAPEHIVLHEMIHSCSVSYFGKNTFKFNVAAEELVTQYLAQELSLKEGIEIFDSGYDDGVTLIREFKRLMNVPKSDLEFATDLIRENLQDRWDFLEEIIAAKFTANTTVAEYQTWLNKLEAIKNWIPKN